MLVRKGKKTYYILVAHPPHPSMEWPLAYLKKCADGADSTRGHGAMAARLTPDQKVGSSNLSALIFHTSLSNPNFEVGQQQIDMTTMNLLVERKSNAKFHFPSFDSGLPAGLPCLLVLACLASWLAGLLLRPMICWPKLACLLNSLLGLMSFQAL